MENNQELIQEVYSELQSLGWPDIKEKKKTNFGELDHPDYTKSTIEAFKSNSGFPKKYFGIDDSNNQGALGEPASMFHRQSIGRTIRENTNSVVTVDLVNCIVNKFI